MGVLRLPRLRTTRFHGGGLPEDRTWREGVLSLKHRRCNETNQYHPAQKSPNENDWLPGNENIHRRTSGGRRAAHDYHHYTAEPARHFVDILPLPNWIIAPLRARGSARKLHPVAGFGCKVFKYLLGLHETLHNRPGFNLLTTRRFHSYGSTKLSVSPDS